MTEPKVIHEDEHFIAIDKPAGLQVHPAKVKSAGPAVPPPTLVDWLLGHYPEVKTVGDDPSTRPGIVHRLDKETSGVMLIARDQKGFDHLKDLFQKHEIKKTYRALVKGDLKNKEGVIDAAIGLRNGTTKRTVRGGRMAKPAVTEYKVLKTFTKEGIAGAHETFSLVEVYPKTGRTHQIRVHFASMGHPIVGDALYGGKKMPLWAHRMMLHASSIEFTTADGKRVKFDSETPF